jgi:hypothetical protein
VKFFERAKRNQEECSNRDQEHEVEQQHGVTSKPVVVAGDYVTKYLSGSKCLQ